MNVAEPYLLIINIVLSCIGFSALGLAYRQVQKKISTNDKGYKYLAFAILPWLISPVLGLGLLGGLSNDPVKWILLYVCSTINNWVLLKALPFFDHFPFLARFPHLFSLKTDDHPWVKIISAICGIFILLTLLLVFLQSPYANWPDALLSATTTGMVGYTFLLSFNHRKLTAFAYLSGFLMSFAVIAPFLAMFEPFKGDENRVQVLILCSHISIIITSFAMVLGWVVDRIGFPVAAHMRLSFNEVKNGQLIVNITVDDRYENMDIDFSQSRYLALLKFAVRKHCSNMGLAKGEYQDNDPTRINEVIRNHKIKLDERNNSKAKNHRRGASDPIEVELLERWPFFFQKTLSGHQLVLLRENIKISTVLIEDQLNASMFPSLQSPAREIKFIKEEFKRHVTNLSST